MPRASGRHNVLQTRIRATGLRQELRPYVGITLTKLFPASYELVYSFPYRCSVSAAALEERRRLVNDFLYLGSPSRAFCFQPVYGWVRISGLLVRQADGHARRFPACGSHEDKVAQAAVSKKTRRRRRSLPASLVAARVP